MASDIWLRTILIVRKETCCCHIGYSYRLTARVLLYASSHRQDNTYHGLCYTSRGALAGTRNSSMGPQNKKKQTICIVYKNLIHKSITTILQYYTLFQLNLDLKFILIKYINKNQEHFLENVNALRYF